MRSISATAVSCVAREEVGERGVGAAIVCGAPRPRRVPMSYREEHHVQYVPEVVEVRLERLRHALGAVHSVEEAHDVQQHAEVDAPVRGRGAVRSGREGGAPLPAVRAEVHAHLGHRLHQIPPQEVVLSVDVGTQQLERRAWYHRASGRELEHEGRLAVVVEVAVVQVERDDDGARLAVDPRVLH